LLVENQSGTLICEWDTDQEVIRQEIEYAEKMNIIAPRKTQNLAVCRQKLESVRPEIITDINSPELRELADREALWQEEQAYYHDKFLYDDRF
jgi:hypothetical protein